MSTSRQYIRRLRAQWEELIEQLLGNQFSSTLLSDGYKAYASYLTKTEGIAHAQCRVHIKRQFFEAHDREPDA